MRRRWLLGATLALAVLAALLLVLQVSRSRGPGGEDAGGDRAARQRARATRVVDRTPSSASGRVTRKQDGAPIAGAVVVLTEKGLGSPKPGQDPEPITAETGADGRWTLASVPPGRYTISASAAGHRPASRTDLLLRPGERKDGLDLALAAGGQSLRGTVTDIGGGPVARAVVSAVRLSGAPLLSFRWAPSSTFTREDGTYELSLEQGRHAVSVFHADYVQAEDDVLVIDRPETLDFILTPGGVIQGRVLSAADRRPVPGAIVTAMGGRSNQGDGPMKFLLAMGGAVATDDEGRFTLRGLGSGALALQAVARGFATQEPTVVELGIGETRADVILLCDAAFSISGVVVRRGKEEPIPGIVLAAYSLGQESFHLAPAPSDDDGYFEIHGVKPGSYFLGAAGEDLVPSVMAAVVTIRDQDVDDAKVVMDTGVTLRGRVEPPGRAVLSLQVNVEEISLGTLFSTIGAALVSGESDEEGRFTLRAVPAGAYDLIARTLEGAEGKLAVVVKTEDQDGLVVTLEERARVAGRVVDDRGRPVAGVMVELDSSSKRDGLKFDLQSAMQDDGARTDENGAFAAAGLSAGRYAVTVKDASGQLAWTDAEHRGKPYEAIPIEIQERESKTGILLQVESRSGSIRGLVTGPEGPIADAWVTAQREWTKEATRGPGENPGWAGAERPVLADADGRFVITGLRAASYEITADAPRGGARGKVIGVKPGADVLIKVEPLGALAGQVMRGSGPVTAFMLNAEGPTHRRKRVAHLEGRYALDRLEPGAYKVVVSGEDGNARGEVKVEPGRTATLDLRLSEWGSVTGVVVDAQTGKPLKGLSAQAVSHDNFAGEDVMSFLTGTGPKTDAEGRFKVGRLGQGKGTLLIVDSAEKLVAMSDPLAMREFTLGPGQHLDLGTLQVVFGARVPVAERGHVGFYDKIATWAERPGGDKKGEPPSGVAADDRLLWVSTVVEGGAAAAAGLQVGDRILGVDGMMVSLVGPEAVSAATAPSRIRIGQEVRLSILRGGETRDVVIVARAKPEG